MTIKEKLVSAKIDVLKNKALVEDIKKALTKAGESASKITNKLTSSGEKVIDDFLLSKNISKPSKQVLRPGTIKREEPKEEKNDLDSTKLDESNVSKSQVDSETSKTKDNKLNNSSSNAKITISIGGSVSTVVKGGSSSPNGRPLPESTLNEINRKKAEAIAKKNKADKGDNQKVNVTVKNKDNQKEQNRQKPQGKNSFSKDNTQFKPKKPQGSAIKTIFNQGAATIAKGTNNKFGGKIQTAKKYDKENTKKQKQKLFKDKSNKYSSNLVNVDYENENVRSGIRKVGAFVKPVAKEEKPLDDIKSIVIPEVVSIKDLASKLRLQPSIIVKKLFLTGKIVNVNTELTYEEAENIALEYDILCEKEIKVDVIAELLKEDAEDESQLVTRPPVVVVMGHVDHGKTSILDTIRNTNVIAKEAGGITQHIGAYQVKIKDRLITFLDTPGHEAFTAMRLRGAKSTDIAILVVAADDGVKPQTIEAINHAKAANVEIIVAVNKIDKPEANVERVKQQLSEYELVPADWGGQTTYCEVSAKKNIGIDNLLEMILLTADVMDLKANPNRKARGIVIESLLDKGKGPVARILVQKGTLHIGDYVAMGKSFGKVRAMTDANGIRLKEATPSTPVEILGLNDVPQAGDTFLCFDNEKEARAFSETFVAENKIKLVEESKHKVTLDALFDQIKAGELKELNIVLKADVAGSSEAIKNSLEKLSNDEVVVKVIHEGVGNINESDVTLASASNAIIIGFNVKPEQNTKSIIEREKVDLRLYNIIYNAIDDVEKAMKGMLAPVYEEKIIGHATIRQIFKASSVGNIAGSYVNDGEIRRNAKVRVKREDSVVYDGNILSLKRFKDEVKEVKAGFECGIVIEGFSDYNVDDVLEAYVKEKKKLSYED